MSDFTVDDTMAEIRYELDDREIYNDIRSEIGVLESETIVDVDSTYSWKWWHRSLKLSPGQQVVVKYEGWSNAISWKLGSYQHAATMPYETTESYYDYSVKLSSSGDSATVTVKNTGNSYCKVWYSVAFKYKTADEVTHEEQTPNLLTVRATDSTSITEYGRRVMNLTWAEGTEESAMQTLVDHALARYKDPVARINSTIKGSTDALRTQIITREISDLITVVCTNLGLNADCFINSISINDNPTGIPVCTWGLEIQRAYELLTLFKLDTSELDGAHVLGS